MARKTNGIPASINPGILFNSSGAPVEIITDNFNTTAQSYNNSVAITATPGSGNFAGLAKTSVGWDGSGRSLAMNNGTVATDANSIGTLSGTPYIGSQAVARYMNGYLLRVTAFPSRLSDTALKSLTV